MSFQVDYIQADAFQSLISDSPFTIPMSRRRTGDRITGTGVILRYRSLVTGNLSIFDVILQSPNAGSTAIIFNVEVDGVPIWAGGARPTIAPGASRAQKTGFEVAVTRAESVIEILIEEIPSIGVPTPIDTILDAVVS